VRRRTLDVFPELRKIPHEPAADPGVRRSRRGVAFLSECLAVRPVPVQPTLLHRWQGRVPDDGLRRVALPFRILASSADFLRVWRAWRPDEPPAIDFGSGLALVFTADGPNTFFLHGLSLDPSGNLRVDVGFTEMYGPGFCFLIVVVTREGVKTVNGEGLSPVS
jgi:hypothetical protein